MTLFPGWTEVGMNLREGNVRDILERRYGRGVYGLFGLFRAVVHYPELIHEPAETGNMATDWNPGVWPQSLLS